jgi:hypothetical protein
VAEEETLLLDALDGVPNDDIGKHLFWLSEKLGERRSASPVKSRRKDI